MQTRPYPKGDAWRTWQAAEKIKAEADHDLTVDGPNLAAQAIAAGLVACHK